MIRNFKKKPIAIVLAILISKSAFAETNYNTTVVVNGNNEHFSDDTTITPSSGNGLELKGAMGTVTADNDAVIRIDVDSGSGMSAITSAQTIQTGNASVILGETHINASSYGIQTSTLLNDTYTVNITLGNKSSVNANYTALNVGRNSIVTIGDYSVITGGSAGPTVAAISASNGASIFIGNSAAITNNNTSVNANAIAVRAADAAGSALTGAKVIIGAGANIKTTATGSGNHAVKAGNTNYWTGSGIIEIGNQANISTVGTSSYGIYNAYTDSLIKLSDDTIVTTTGNNSSAMRSGTSTNYSGGKIIVGNYLNLLTSGHYAYGLHSVYDGSEIIVSNHSEITTLGQSSYAVYAQSAGIINIGDITNISTTGSSAHGLYATGSGSEISTGESATVSTDGSNSYGIYAASSSSVLVGEGISVTTNGLSAHGIFSSNASVTLGDGGSITVNSADKTSILSRSPNGIYVTSRGSVNLDGGITVTMAGDHQSDSYAMNADSGGIIDGSAGGRFVLRGDILSSGASAANSSTSQQKSTIKLNMTESSLWTGASYIETNTSGTGIIDLTMSDAVWNMTGSSKVTNLNLSQGIVNFQAPSSSGAFKTLTVYGDYNGGGTFIINTALGGDDSATDELIVEGNTSGTSDLIVNNYNGTGVATVNGIEVVNVAGQSDGIFTLGNRVVAGAYEYSIEKNGNNWYLVNTLYTPEPEPNPTPTPDPEPEPNPTPTPDPEPEPNPTPTPDPDENKDKDKIKVIRPETGAYIANLAAANNLFISRLHDRLGETQYTDYLTGETKVTSMWLRQEGGHNRSRIQSGQAKTQQNRYVVQLGGDIAQWSSDELDRFHLGVMASYGHIQGNTTSKYTIHRTKNKVEGYALGLYGTWYANQADKSGLYVDSWVQYAWFDNTVQGDGIAKEEYNSKGWLASVETGYSFKLSGDERSSYWLQPKAQLTWMGVHADQHYEANGTKVTGNGDNLLTRLGLRAYRQGYSDVDAHTGRVYQPFVEVNWLHNSKNFGVTMSDVSEYQSGARNIGEVKVGVEGHLNKNLNMWGSIGQQIGDKGYSDTQAIIGIKYSF